MMTQFWALCSLIMAGGFIIASSKGIPLEDDDGDVVSIWALAFIVAIAPIVFVVNAFRNK